MLGEKIKNLRKERGWSQKALAERSGVNQGFISEIETGKKRPGLDTIRALANVFGTSIDFIAEEIEGGIPLTAHIEYPDFHDLPVSAQKKIMGACVAEPITESLSAAEFELVELYRATEVDRRRVIIDCARACADASAANVESRGKGGGESDLTGKRSNSK